MRLSQQGQDTHLLTTDEPNSERQGQRFDHHAFADFPVLVLASLNRVWKVKVTDCR
jgi:hypothetical protein